MKKNIFYLILILTTSCAEKKSKNFIEQTQNTDSLDAVVIDTTIEKLTLNSIQYSDTSIYGTWVEFEGFAVFKDDTFSFRPADKIITYRFTSNNAFYKTTKNKLQTFEDRRGSFQTDFNSLKLFLKTNANADTVMAHGDTILIWQYPCYLLNDTLLRLEVPPVYPHAEREYKDFKRTTPNTALANSGQT